MKFKVGDIVRMVKRKELDDPIPPNPEIGCLLVVTAPHHNNTVSVLGGGSWSEYRFELANDASYLEKVIYDIP